jgi:phenylacetic acid degradation operon negative regulatory protein
MTVTTPKDSPRLSRRRETGLSSARSLLLTVLGEFVLPQDEPVWTSAIIAALAPLGVAEKAARQALARSAAEGWISSRRHGRLAQWDLTRAGRQLLTEGARRIYSFGADGQTWDGRWLVLLVSGPDITPELRRLLRTRLTWAGFGALPVGTWVCPDPAREAEASRILTELGLAGISMSFIARYGAIGSEADIVEQAWDLRAVEQRYKQFIGEFESLTIRGDAEMMTAQTLLVHEWRRFPFLDPQLPRDLLPASWPGADAAALFHARHAAWRERATAHWRALSPGPSRALSQDPEQDL